MIIGLSTQLSSPSSAQLSSPSSAQLSSPTSAQLEQQHSSLFRLQQKNENSFDDSQKVSEVLGTDTKPHLIASEPVSAPVGDAQSVQKV